MVSLVHLAQTAKTVLMADQEMSALQDPEVCLDFRARLVSKETRVQLGFPVEMERTVLKGPRVTRDPLVTLDLPVLLDYKGHKDREETLVFPALQETMVRVVVMVREDLMVPLVPMANTALRVYRDSMDRRASLVPLD